MTTKLVVFDVLTSGLTPEQHQVIAFGALAVEIPSWKERDCIQLRIQLDGSRPADPESLRMNQYSPEIWHDAVRARDAVRSIATFLDVHATVGKTGRTGRSYEVAQLCCHHAPFHASFLRALFKEQDKFLPAAYEVLDTLALVHWARLALPKERQPADFKLATLCAWLGVPTPAAADPLSRAKAAAALGERLLGAMVSAASS